MQTIDEQDDDGHSVNPGENNALLNAVAGLITKLKIKYMNNEQKKKLIKCCEQVAYDVENDAKEFDGRSFDGKTVATYFGYHGAAIKALSEVIKNIIEDTITDNMSADSGDVG
jgi:hypothetical protein